MGCVQHVEECGAADGAQHGVRTGPAGDPGELDLSWAHLYEVRADLSSAGGAAERHAAQHDRCVPRPAAGVVSGGHASGK
jgi:hypothetical protein